jgi:lipopolysaccharide/colanic/teichoic acid biosynthesis glycosyltransferase
MIPPGATAPNDTALDDGTLLGRPSRARTGTPPVRLVERPLPLERANRRGQLIRRLLLVADVLSLSAVFAVVELYVLETERGFDPQRLVEYVVFGLLGLGVMALHGLYGRDEVRPDHTTTDDFSSILHAVTLACFGALVVTELLGTGSTTAVLVAWATALVYIPTIRAAARMVARRRPAYVQRTLVLGAGDVGQLMARKLLTHPEYGLELSGFVDADPRQLTPDVAHVPVLGTPDDIPRLVRERRIERVIVAFSGQSHVEELDTIRMLKDLDLQVDIVPRLFEVVGPNADISVFEGLSVFALPPMRLSRGSLVAKRALDVLVAGIGLIAVAPLMTAIAIAIKIDTRGPLLYRGNRIGPKGRLFAQLKFRSMDPRFATAEGDAAFREILAANPSMAMEFASTQKLTNDPRVTRVGRFLRRTSLDELPQLFNVLRGDLSLVGPRPITERELQERYRPRMLAPHDTDSLLIGYWTARACALG